ncbi:hypothetical protein [Solihabitans fulvus]|uniref:hypothetical protein n=1 Tax=Solihabitans fulvus TaxID=1892852 RepID=UPI001661D88F|nr:hypothetical protein [Solihabitans fulvus]
MSEPLLTEPRLSTLRAGLLVALFGVITLLICYWLLGAPWPWAAVLTAPVGAVVWLTARTPRATEPVWQPLPDPLSTATELQASTLAGRLAEAAEDQSRFRGRVQPRLRALALARLRQLPGNGDLADLADPRAAALLGPELHHLLTNPAARLPGPAGLTDLLNRLEAL